MLPAPGGSERDAVGGDDLDRPRQFVDGDAVEEAAVVGQAHVGQQVAVPGRLRRPGRGDSRRRSSGR